MDEQHEEVREKKTTSTDDVLEVGLLVVVFLLLSFVIKVLDVCSLVIVAFALFGILSSVYRMSEGNWGIDVISILLVSFVVLYLYYFVRPKYKKTRRYKKFEQLWL
ncbi:MAG: hypothetical protein P1U42_00135 [Phycisphaerales bacterium]|nr:hypothetical protein [Phycisphaerales bacterium]